MKSTCFTYFICIIIGLMSCNKPGDNSLPPEPLDTIHPLPYYPVYPGSFWKYVDSNDDTLVIMTDSVYRKDWYTPDEDHKPDTAYVPFCDQVGVWGYMAHTGEDLDVYCFTRILSDSLPVGAGWYISYIQFEPYLYEYDERQIITIDTTIEIFGRSFFPTIIIREYHVLSDVYGYKTFERYYTKDIGLVKEEQFINYDSLVNTRLLIGYHINN
jgi:hypothetical protein